MWVSIVVLAAVRKRQKDAVRLDESASERDLCRQDVGKLREQHGGEQEATSDEIATQTGKPDGGRLGNKLDAADVEALSPQCFDLTHPTVPCWRVPIRETRRRVRRLLMEGKAGLASRVRVRGRRRRGLGTVRRRTDPAGTPHARFFHEWE